MLKRGIFVIFYLVICVNLGAQHLSHQVMVSTGSVTSNSGFSISQTLGEPVIEYIKGPGYELTQGFQQPSLSIIDPIVPLGNGVNVFPNPVINTLTLELFGEASTHYRVTIFGFNGQIYFENDYPCMDKYWHKIPLDVSQFQRGIYFVRVVAENGKISRLFKIEKM